MFSKVKNVRLNIQEKNVNYQLTSNVMCNHHLGQYCLGRDFLCYIKILFCNSHQHIIDVHCTYTTDLKINANRNLALLSRRSKYLILFIIDLYNYLLIVLIDDYKLTYHCSGHFTAFTICPDGYKKGTGTAKAFYQIYHIRDI